MALRKTWKDKISFVKLDIEKFGKPGEPEDGVNQGHCLQEDEVVS
jgi:hypothetical protein